MAKNLLPLLFVAHSLVLVSSVSAITPAELDQRAKKLPSVEEAAMPALPNDPTAFRGLIEHSGLEGNTWVTFPFIENPSSFGFDSSGALYVVEASRFWQGVPDLRGASEMVRDDFQSETVEDRLAMYEKFSANFPKDWFTRVSDRIIKLEDTDGNGAADKRTLFADGFNHALDGIGFSVLADEGSVFFTNIPNVWRLTDTDDDGRADEKTVISTGYGPRVSMLGHDLHGVIRGPDGRLYFSVGDRGYHLTDGAGKTHAGAGRGAIFRCESDGSNLEVFCFGLRNPQEIVFDDYGNLFTFDNTGDIGDRARMVYALEGSDSGWDMSHQSAHQYANDLDWGLFRPDNSLWMEERMSEPYNSDQPQWVYPPASYVARGPAGVTRLTGSSLPEDLRDTFLLSNYRGPSQLCTVLSVKVEPKGAGYVAISEEVVFKGIGVSDVELGYDGKIYLCDFGGGWTVNESGTVQAVQSTDPAHREAGNRVQSLFQQGWVDRDAKELRKLLSDTDRRVRQAAQFAIVKQDDGLKDLTKIAKSRDPLLARLHAIWGLGQLGRTGSPVGEALLPLLTDSEPEIRANTARVLGDMRAIEAKEDLIELLAKEDSHRVRSLVAIALGRIADSGDPAASEALFSAAVRNGDEGADIVLRHALLTGLKATATEESAAARADSPSREERLVAILTLRHLASPLAVQFLSDSDTGIVRETIRALYDTDAADSESIDAIARLGNRTAKFPQSIQRRIVAANYRNGTAENAREMLALASNAELTMPVRKAALYGLQFWEDEITTDPVLGTYRPLVATTDRTAEALKEAIGGDLRYFLSMSSDSELTTLAVELATEIGVELEERTLLSQVRNDRLSPTLRVAVFEALVQSGSAELPEVVQTLLTDSQPEVRAAAMAEAFVIPIEGIEERAKSAIATDELIVARSALGGLSKIDPPYIENLFSDREHSLRKGLWLDAFLYLSETDSSIAAEYASEKPESVFLLAEHGGDFGKGEIVFQNQGACLQCHKIGGLGGAQGPDLSIVGQRLSREKILESIWNPAAEVAKGYGMATVLTKEGDAIMGRLADENADYVTVVGLDNSERTIDRDKIDAITPPISAMPPMAAALSPPDLRDLIAYLSSLNGAQDNSSDREGAHGDGEDIAK